MIVFVAITIVMVMVVVVMMMIVVGMIMRRMIIPARMRPVVCSHGFRLP